MHFLCLSCYVLSCKCISPLSFPLFIPVIYFSCPYCLSICSEKDFELTLDGDSEEEEISRPVNRKAKVGGRTKECPGCGAMVGVSIKECSYCDHNFTSKSLLTSSHHTANQEATDIRQRFSFEPERDEDGSLLIEKVLGRRPCKGSAFVLNRSPNKPAYNVEISAAQAKYDHEYLIKYKAMSYAKAKWCTAYEIETMGVKSKSLLARYLTKLDRGALDINSDDVDIDPTFTEVEKILDMREEDVFESVDVDMELSEAPSEAPTIEGVEGEEATGTDIITAADSETLLPLTKRESFAERDLKDKLDMGEDNDSNQVVSDDESDGDDNASVASDSSQKPLSATAIFNHNERCKKVLERIWDDPLASSFIDPVDTTLFEDYLDIVEEPICLSDVKEKWEEGVYQKYHQHNKFIQDLRRIWQNCKTYNLHKSSIWYSAHFLSLFSERLYQAWVLSFSSGDTPMDDPLGCPWEGTCRRCCKDDNEDQLVLCDHCDAPWHIYCVKPALETIPEGIWLCKRCNDWMDKTSSAKSLTATVEDEARKLADNTKTTTLQKVRKKKYLVKWRGLSYRDCTWELPEDLDNDEAIKTFHMLNDMPPDDPPLTQAELDAELRKDRARPVTYAQVPGVFYNPAYDLDSEVYAQIRAFHFLKWGKIPPPALLKECGAAPHAYTDGYTTNLLLKPSILKEIEDIHSGKKLSSSNNKSSSSCNDNKEKKEPVVWAPIASGDPVRGECASIIANVVTACCRFTVSSSSRTYDVEKLYPSSSKLPPQDIHPSEYEVAFPKRRDGSLGIRVYEYGGRAVLWGMIRTDKAVTSGAHPLEKRAKVGDIVTGINGVSVVDMPFNSVLTLLKTVPSPFVYLRFLRTIERTGQLGAAERVQEHQKRITYNLIPPDTPFIDDPEQDVYLRYLNKQNKKPKSVRPADERSQYQGVHRTSEGLWMGSFWTYDHPENPDDCLCKNISELTETDLFVEESAAAWERERLMRNVIAQCEKGINENTLNFEAGAIAIDDPPSFTTNTAVLSRLVLAERAHQDELAAALLKEGARSVAGVLHDTRADQSEEGWDNEEGLVKNLGANDNDGLQGISSDAIPISPSISTTANGATGEGKTSTTPVSADSKKSKKSKSPAKSPPKDGAEQEDVVDDRSVSLDSRDSESDMELFSEEEMEESTDDEKSDDSEVADEWEEDQDGEWKPSSQIAQQNDGPTSRLLRAVNEATMPPRDSDWKDYVLENARAVTVVVNKDLAQEEDRIRGGFPVDQVDIASGAVIRTWTNANKASRGLQIPKNDILAVISGKLEKAGGFLFKENRDKMDLEVAEALEMLDGDEVENEKEIIKKTDESGWKQRLPKKTKVYRSGGTLRDYQVEGLNWLLSCWYRKKSSILADEMGLGKTVQVVTFLEHLFEIEQMRGPFLICVPLSTIAHWQRESEGWTFMNINVYHDAGGGRDMRDVIREFEWYYKGRSRRLLKFHLLITTYDDLIRDYEELAEVPWRVVVVDEAHRLRNANSKLLDCMRSVLSRGMNAYGYQHRVLLTGTPLQNNTAELWSLLNFIEPAKFPDAEKFASRFGNIKTQEQVEGLQRRIAPHLLRRVKEDVAKDIPPKEETVIDVELTTMQKQYYRAIYEHNHGFLMQTLKGSLPKLMNIQMELRKCCNHPFLIHGVEDSEMDSIERKIDSHQDLQNLATRQKDKEYRKRRMEDVFIPTSGKMVLLDKLLPKLRKEGHKVLIFSQMVRMIDYIEEYCEYREYPVERLDGRVSGNERQKSIDRFNNNINSFVFLLSTRAGGVGINLTAADTVIIFDSDWNPQNDVQAMARCHRIGQTSNVTIYRLITRKSFEAEMFDRASKKLGLEQAVLGTRDFKDIDLDKSEKDNKKVDAAEMEALLREGAYAVLMDDNEEDIKEFCEEDIDQILTKRSHVFISEGGQQTESWLNKRKKGGRTKKSVFTGDTSTKHQDIDVNDPDFWKKVLPDLVTPESMVERFESEIEGGEVSTKDIKKFFKDLSACMDGMVDLYRRNQLPEHERRLCMNLLLKISLMQGGFSEKDRQQAQDWYSIIDGARVRKSRTDLQYNPDDYDHTGISPEAEQKGGKSKGRSSRGGGRGSRGSKIKGRDWDAYFDGDSDRTDDDDDIFQDYVDDEDGDKGKRRKRGRGGGPGSRGGKGRPKKATEPVLDEDGNWVVPAPAPRKRGGPGSRGGKGRPKKATEPVLDEDGNWVVPAPAPRKRGGPGSRGGKGSKAKDKGAKRMKKSTSESSSLADTTHGTDGNGDSTIYLEDNDFEEEPEYVPQKSKRRAADSAPDISELQAKLAAKAAVLQGLAQTQKPTDDIMQDDDEEIEMDAYAV